LKWGFNGPGSYGIDLVKKTGFKMDILVFRVENSMCPTQASVQLS